MNHKDKISSLSTFLPVELFAFFVAFKGEMAMFYMKVIFCFGLQPTASHEVHTTPAERQKKIRLYRDRNQVLISNECLYDDSNSLSNSISHIRTNRHHSFTSSFKSVSQTYAIEEQYKIHKYLFYSLVL